MRPIRVIAIISAFNEADIVSYVIEHLVENDIDVYMLDNLSTDDTVQQAMQWKGRGLIDIERFPADSPSDVDPKSLPYDWTAILLHKEKLARELDADWFIHHDADEFREAPFPGISLRDAIQWVDRFGYNAINFKLINFQPTDDHFSAGDDPREYFRYYEEGKAYDHLQTKCWKNMRQPVDLAATGGHDVTFEGRRIFPIRFLLRHYPIRGERHGLRKVFNERKGRFLGAERARGWHVQYDEFDKETCSFIKDITELVPYRPDHVRLELLLNNQVAQSQEEKRRELAMEVDRLAAELDLKQSEVEGWSSQVRAVVGETKEAMREMQNGLVEQLKRRLEEKEAHYEEKIKALEEHHRQNMLDQESKYTQQLRTLENWIEQLLKDADESFASLRWRIGSLIATGADLIRLRGRSATARDHIAEVAGEFRTWRSNEPTGRALQLQSTPRVARGPNPTTASLPQLIVTALWHPGTSFSLLSWQRIQNLFITCIKQPDYVRREIIYHYLTLYDSRRKRELAVPDKGWNQRRDLITFPKSDSPDISVVIPVHNQFDTTWASLSALLENSAGVEYEVIVADDASGDRTRAITEYCNNIRVIRSEVNQGFVENCNGAVSAAKGPYVLLLNNDAFVKEACLRFLLDTARRDEMAGIVGPKLIYPDGRLQEAGGIIWNDGSAWNYGRGDDPYRPEYNYVREVDYISGAAILVRWDLWECVGGFDRQFSPAYYEDVDLAFEARQRGFKVIYQPKAVVVHTEGVSHGTEETTGIKSYQSINRTKFLNKWRSELERAHFANGECVFQARERVGRRTTVLVIDHYVPEFDRDAGSRSTFQYLRLMINHGVRVKFLPDNFHNQEPYTSILEELGIEVLYGDWYRNNWKRWWRENHRFIDTVYMHRPHIAARYIDKIARKTQVKTVYFGHDLHHLRVERQCQLEQKQKLRREAEKWRDLEFEIIRKCDVVYYPSVTEVEELKRHFPDKDIRAIPLYIVEPIPEPVLGFEERSGILFVGGFQHPPNVDGVMWFIEEIWPRVVKECSDVVFLIVGSRVPEKISRLNTESIVVKGWVSDQELRALYERTRVAVIPLRYGAGVKGKVLEAHQHRLPVVTTSIGAEGLPDPLDYISVGDDAEAFARAVVEVYTNHDKWREMSEKGAEMINKHFSVARALEAVGEDFGLQRELS